MTPPATPAAAGWRLPAATLLDLALAGALLFGGNVAVSVVLVVLRNAGVDVGPPGLGLAGLPVLLVPLAVLVTLVVGLALWLLHRRRLPAAPRPWAAAMVVQALLAAFALQAIAFGHYQLTAALGMPVVGSNIDMFLSAYNAFPVITALAVVVAAPVGEELLLRRVMLHRFAQAGRPLLGLLLSSMLFALLHEPLPGEREPLAWLLSLLPYALFGAGFGVLYLRTGRLAIAVLAHASVNTIGMAALVFGNR